jgi:hypothetical protein
MARQSVRADRFAQYPAHKIPQLLAARQLSLQLRRQLADEGEKLGFDRPPRRYGVERLWATVDGAPRVNFM